MNEPLIDHPTVRDHWGFADGRTGTCWICGQPTPWIYLDLGWQHPECEWPIDQT